MQPKTTGTIAAEMLEIANHTTEKVHVCFYNNEIAARQSKHVLEVHPVFGIWTANDVQKGLTPEQWESLGEKITKFYLEKQ